MYHSGFHDNIVCSYYVFIQNVGLHFIAVSRENLDNGADNFSDRGNLVFRGGDGKILLCGGLSL